MTAPANIGLDRNKLFRRTHDPMWHLQGGIVLIMGLQLITSPALLPYNKYLMVALEALLMLALLVVTPDAYGRVSSSRRTLTLTLIAVIAVGNILSLFLLLDALLSHVIANGTQLLLNAVVIYATNIIMFALAYWELDGNGPDRRATSRGSSQDFLFTQNAHPNLWKSHWLPGFTDYLYLSATNVTNFASADTVPLTHRAKVLMMVQSLVSVIIVVLVAARAVSILQ